MGLACRYGAALEGLAAARIQDTLIAGAAQGLLAAAAGGQPAQAAAHQPSPASAGATGGDGGGSAPPASGRGKSFSAAAAAAAKPGGGAAAGVAAAGVCGGPGREASPPLVRALTHAAWGSFLPTRMGCGKHDYAPPPPPLPGLQAPGARGSC